MITTAGIVIGVGAGIALPPLIYKDTPNIPRVGALPEESENIPRIGALPDTAMPYASPTRFPRPTQTPNPASAAAVQEVHSPDRCEVFNQIGFDITYLSRDNCSSHATLYLKMDGGVPGLAYDVANDYEAWNYEIRVGDIYPQACGLQGYDDRLYCTVPIPVNYDNTLQRHELYINGCESPVYSRAGVTIPEPVGCNPTPTFTPVASFNPDDYPCDGAAQEYYDLTEGQCTAIGGVGGGMDTCYCISSP